MELAVLGHVLFLKTHKSVDLGLLTFREQTEKGHAFIPTLFRYIQSIDYCKPTRPK